MRRYVILEKAIGQTPLECVEQYRNSHPELTYKAAEDFWMRLPFLQVAWRRSRVFWYGEEPRLPKKRQDRQKDRPLPLAYAGRLDPMASGKLLVLIGEECKHQEKYHGLDKAYTFSVLFGVATDTQDVLGRIQEIQGSDPCISPQKLKHTCAQLLRKIELPYPHFSSKTVHGKPLHVWTLEGRLGEITIPTKTSEIYKLTLKDVVTRTGQEIFNTVAANIACVTPVTDERKALGNDFRRVDVLADWSTFRESYATDSFTIATFSCIATSGTYMRTLATVIAEACGTTGLAYSIHRTNIGHFKKLPFWGGIWTKRF